FAVGIELDRVAALVPIANGLAQARNTLRYRIPVGGGPAGGLDQLVDDVLGRGAVGVAHRHVDDVLPAPPGGHLELAGNVEHVRGQTLDAGELPHGNDSLVKAGDKMEVCGAAKLSNLAQAGPGGKWAYFSPN